MPDIVLGSAGWCQVKTDANLVLIKSVVQWADNSNYLIFKTNLWSKPELEDPKESDRVSHVSAQPERAQKAVPEEMTCELNP